MEPNKLQILGVDGVRFLIVDLFVRKKIIQWLNTRGVFYPGQRINNVPTAVLANDLAEILIKESSPDVIQIFDLATQVDLAQVKGLDKTELKHLDRLLPEIIKARRLGRLLWALASDGRDEALKQIPKIINKAFAVIPSLSPIPEPLSEESDQAVPEAMMKRIRDLEKELAQEQEKVKALKNEREKLRQELVALGNKKGELQREKEGLLQVQRRLQAELDELRQEIAARKHDKDTIRELEKENKRLHYELEKVKELSNTDSFLALTKTLLEKIHHDWSLFSTQSLKQNQEILAHLREIDRELKGMKPFLIRLNKTKEGGETKRARVGIFVDTQNIFYAAKDYYQKIIDYEKLRSYVIRDRICHRAIAYIVQAPDYDQSRFTDYLSRLGFEIKTQPLIVRGDGSKKGDVDINIAIDILQGFEDFDILALVSGDGDFVPLISQLKAKGKRVEVYSFLETTSLRLKEVCDEFYPLGEEVLSPAKTL